MSNDQAVPSDACGTKAHHAGSKGPNVSLLGPLQDGIHSSHGVEVPDGASENRFILSIHLLLGLSVFGLIGYAVYKEMRRMRKLEEAHGDTALRSKKSNSPGHDFPSPSWLAEKPTGLRRPKSARRFAAEYALYRADYLLSSAAFAKPLLLLGLTYVIIILGGIAYSYLSGLELLEALWLSWTMIADPGAHSDTQGTKLRALSLALTLAGMLVFALMIGIVADGVSNFLDSLKQGHAGVVEMEHTLILGWSQKTIPCVRELCLANESLKGAGVVVILADRDKQEMENELRAALSNDDLRGTLVVFRSGKVTSESDLTKVSCRHARAIIVLAEPSLDADASDARAVRVVMCLSKIFQEQESVVEGHIVVELCDVDNRDLIPLVAPMRCEVVVSHDMIGRMMIVCARQPGLTQVLPQLLTFEGAEFYFKNWPELNGKTFGEVSFMFPDAVVVGVTPFSIEDAFEQLERSRFEIDVWSKANRRVLLNPPADYVLRENDLLVVLAEDDDSYSPRGLADSAMKEARGAFESVEALIPLAPKTNRSSTPENFLFCGFRRDMDDMILELDLTVAPGSKLTILTNLNEDILRRKLEEGGLDLTKTKNLEVTLVRGNHVLRRDLNKLPLETFSSILILAEEEFENTMDEADSRTLTCLLIIRDIVAKRLSLNDAPTVGSGKIKVMGMGMGSLPSMPAGERDGEPFASSRRFQFKKSEVHGLTRRPSTNGGNDVFFKSASHDAAKMPPINVSQAMLQDALIPSSGDAVSRTVILCEILDTQTKALMPIAKVTDNLLTNEIVSSCLSLIAESASTNEILSELLHSEGNDIKLVSSLDYGEQGEMVSIWDLSARARARSEVLMGYKLSSTSRAHLNPTNKSEKIALNVRTSLIIMSENPSNKLVEGHSITGPS